jgi:hypothetical protein
MKSKLDREGVADPNGLAQRRTAFLRQGLLR